MYKLGYVERSDLGTVPSSGTVPEVETQAVAAATKPSFFRSLFSTVRPESPSPRSILQVCVLGGDGVGKSSFVWDLTGLRAPGLGDDVEIGSEYSKFSDAVVVGGCTVRRANMPAAKTSSTAESSGSMSSHSNDHHRNALRGVLTDPFHLSISAIPLKNTDQWRESCVHSCDLVVLMFQCGVPESLEVAISLEQQLPATIPRIFVASKSDMIPSAQVIGLGSHTGSRSEFGNETRSTREALKATHEHMLQEAYLHVNAHHLPALTQFSTLTGEGVDEAYSLIVDTVVDPQKGIPRQSSAQKAGYHMSTAVALVTSLCVIGLGSVYMLHRPFKDWLNEWISSTQKLLLGNTSKSP